ncbi:MAG: DUF362 domain-containing protein [Anaerolineae bacterium]|nr:DUF362 domain-containing protein [Anaerolineae bacterium]MDW8070542.1 DUF362 domain-containing protein [Anaerolineae bacterium]
MRCLGRRDFLKAAMAALVGGWMAGWRDAAVGWDALARPSDMSQRSTLPLLAHYQPVPIARRLPPRDPTTPVPVPSRAELMAHWPATEKSRVVVVRHREVLTAGQPNPDIVLQMLDEGISALAHGAQPLEVWRVLFDPQERVLLKVNCIAAGGPTQPAVTYAIARRLQDAGLRAENLLIFDRTDHELADAGYALNEGGSGVQCRGTRGEGSEAVLTQATVRFWRELDECDAIVNIPTPKAHGIAGVSVALKNHYGSISEPAKLHANGCDPAIPELNAHPLIRDKTRLHVAAALRVSPFDWNAPRPENALLLSFDPVALDTVARDILVRHHQAAGADAGFLIYGAHHLVTAQQMQLGATAPERIELHEIVLA